MYDSIRQSYVKGSPEEIVRQTVLGSMESLGYPKHLLSVEKSLKECMAFSVQEGVIPDRRVDIVCYLPKGVHPLIIIECKADRFSSDAIYQVIGYNKFIKASFIAIANPYEVLTGWYDVGKQQYQFIKTLPSYKDLIQAVYG